jgi:hypothetical protein
MTDTKLTKDQIAEAIAGQVEAAIAAPAAWNKASVLLPADIREAVISQIKVRKREIQRRDVLKSAVSEQAREDDFDASIDAIVDAMATISENVHVLKWETVGQRGQGTKSFKQRVAKCLVMNGEIAIQHKEPKRD